MIATGGIAARVCRIAMLGVALLVSAPSVAEVGDPSTARFLRLDSRGGLSQDTPLALAQDRHGFIWVGTQAGLNRFDGEQVRVYQADPDLDGSLLSSWISALAYDKRHTLWVGTHRGVHRHDEHNDRFQRYSLTADGSGGDTIYCLHQDADGELWVGSDAGLSHYQAATDSFISYSITGETEADFGPGQVRAIASAGQEIWVGTTAGLFRFDKQSKTFSGFAELGPIAVNALVWDGTDQLWIGTDQRGLFRLTADRGLQPIALEHPRVHALHIDRAADLWIGGERSAYRLRIDAAGRAQLEAYAHRPRDPFSVGQGRVPSFLEAADGSFWIGAWEGGVSWTDPKFSRIRSLTRDNGGLQALGDTRVLSVAVEGESFWLGGDDGVAHYDPPSGAITPLEATRGMLVFTLLARPDALWIGTGLGIYRYDRASKQLVESHFHPDLDRARIRRLMVDGDRLWIFAELVGLHVIDLKGGVSIASHRFVGNIYFIDRLDDARVLVTASDGLHWFSRDGLQRLHHRAVGPGEGEASLPAPVSGFARDSRGRVWLASYGAGAFELIERQPGQAQSALFRRLPRLTELSNLSVNSVQIDAEDRLWLASDRGISMWDPASSQVRNLDDIDGALVRGYYFSASVQTPSGRVGLGSKEGFSLFDTRQSFAATPPPPPRLTGLSVGNRWQQVRWRMPASVLAVPPHLAEHIELRPGMGRSIGFRFASPAYTEGRKLRYRYRLDGFDTDWVALDAGRREASYTNLAPGAYRLRIVAYSGWGAASEEASVALSIAPHWWETWWSKLLWLLLVGLLVAAWVRWRVHRLRNLRATLERQVKERTHELVRAREQAEQSLSELQVTQEELIRSEKLSALGGLVASVAHEVNTPIGVALTASSHLSGRVKQLDEQFQGGRMTRSELAAFVAAAQEGSDMVQRNLERAASLISSFKRVSADRSSDERRRFNLAEVLNELLQSLKLVWKRRSIELIIECPDDIEMDSYPGALGQILTNLAQNAVLHAFAGRDSGTMRLAVLRLEGELLQLKFSDDGNGIPTDHLAHIFEPFFTTRRDQGGTGLGLHIVHNLVKQSLGGRITVSSEPGQGTEFVIEMPRVAPHYADHTTEGHD